MNHFAGLHLYVTRRAALTYQQIIGAGFEASRRALTERVLRNAAPDPQHPDCYLFHLQSPAGNSRVRVYTQREDRLLIVRKVVEVPADA